MNSIVLTFANKRNQFLDEWEQSVKQLNIPYKILGIGTIWKGFKTKIIGYYEELKNINPEKIVILCDSYDLLFLEPLETILEKYNKITPEHKILIGCEPLCGKDTCKQITCINDNINDPSIITKRSFLNSGFVMGPASSLLEALNIVKEYDDDQIGYAAYINENCDKFVFDYSSSIILNYQK